MHPDRPYHPSAPSEAGATVLSFLFPHHFSRGLSATCPLFPILTSLPTLESAQGDTGQPTASLESGAGVDGAWHAPPSPTLPRGHPGVWEHIQALSHGPQYPGTFSEPVFSSRVGNQARQLGSGAEHATVPLSLEGVSYSHQNSTPTPAFRLWGSVLPQPQSPSGKGLSMRSRSKAVLGSV